MAKPIIYWIDSDGPGRMAILARPQGHDALEADIQSWRDDGIDAVVSLLTDADNRYLGLTAEGDLCRSHGLQFVGFPIEDFGVPASFEVGLELVKELNELLLSGKSVGFHCNGSIGRAPLIASCVLMFSGESPAQAYELVGRARGYPIPEAHRQAEWGEDFARQLSLIR